VIPTTRLRIERVRRWGARLELEATEFLLACEADWLEVVGGDSVFALATDSVCSSAEAELSGVAPAEVAAASVEAAVCG
jgi:hypothetical protein